MAVPTANWIWFLWPARIVPSASPILHDVLDRWNRQRTEGRQAITVTLDALREESRPLQEQWFDFRQLLKQEVENLDEASNRIFSRHVDHLRRLETWKNEILLLHGKFEPIQKGEQATAWFARIEVFARPFSEALLVSAERAGKRYAQAHERLVVLDRELDDRTAELQLFRQRVMKQKRPFLVSRGRKNPEVAFVEKGAAEQAALSLELQALRRSVAHGLKRIYRAAHLVEKNVKVNPGRFELHRNALLKQLRPAQEYLFQLREKVLTDALTYEASRKKLNWIHDVVKSMRCIEDVYRAPVPFWKQLFHSETFSTKNR
jgi:hypothetical protein